MSFEAFALTEQPRRQVETVRARVYRLEGGWRSQLTVADLQPVLFLATGWPWGGSFTVQEVAMPCKKPGLNKKEWEGLLKALRAAIGQAAGVPCRPVERSMVTWQKEP